MAFKKFRLHRDHSGRRSMYALISQQQFLFMNNFAKFNLAVRGAGVSTSGRDQCISNANMSQLSEQSDIKMEIPFDHK